MWPVYNLYRPYCLVFAGTCEPFSLYYLANNSGTMNAELYYDLYWYYDTFLQYKTCVPILVIIINTDT